jgi:hypothetical protein
LLVDEEVIVALDVWVHDGHHLAAVAADVALHLDGIGEHTLIPLRDTNTIHHIASHYTNNETNIKKKKPKNENSNVQREAGNCAIDGVFCAYVP